MTPSTKPLLITGHPRGGTGYMAALCRACDWDIGHEVMGRDGISSWMMAPPVWHVPAPYHARERHRGRNWYRFERSIIVVREPLAHAASVAYVECTGTPWRTVSQWWRSVWCPIPYKLDATPFAPRLASAVRSIVDWHAWMEQWLPGAEVIRLEDARARLPELLARPVAREVGVVNARKHPPVTWPEIVAACEPDLIEQFRHYGERLGYPMP